MSEGLRLVLWWYRIHLIVNRCNPLGITGRQGSEALAAGGIYTNRNSIPYDPGSALNNRHPPRNTGPDYPRMKEEQMEIIGKIIAKTLKNLDDEKFKKKLAVPVAQLTKEFPIYSEIN
jgi:glycine hydroxymethyltransferase